MYKLVSSYCCGDLVIQQNVGHATTLERASKQTKCNYELAKYPIERSMLITLIICYALCTEWPLTKHSWNDLHIIDGYTAQCTDTHIPKTIEFLYMAPKVISDAALNAQVNQWTQINQMLIECAWYLPTEYNIQFECINKYSALFVSIPFW